MEFMSLIPLMCNNRNLDNFTTENPLSQYNKTFPRKVLLVWRKIPLLTPVKMRNFKGYTTY